jgi:hypothetical protein
MLELQKQQWFFLTLYAEQEKVWYRKQNIPTSNGQQRTCTSIKSSSFSSTGPTKSTRMNAAPTQLWAQ